MPAPKTTVKGLPLGRPRLKCDECRSGRRKTPVTVPATGPCQLAAEATIAALQAAGHLEPADSSRVAALRATAAAVDADPLNAALHREHRMAETALRLSGASVQEVDAYSQLLSRLDSSGGQS
ncbi:MAG: hypothetical protein ACLQEG_05070 [Acidimicrobiales bacterium]